MSRQQKNLPLRPPPRTFKDLQEATDYVRDLVNTIAQQLRQARDDSAVVEESVTQELWTVEDHAAGDILIDADANKIHSNNGATEDLFFLVDFTEANQCLFYVEDIGIAGKYLYIMPRTPWRGMQATPENWGVGKFFKAEMNLSNFSIPIFGFNNGLIVPNIVATGLVTWGLGTWVLTVVEDCEATTGWTAEAGVTRSLDTDVEHTGAGCIKLLITAAAGKVMGNLLARKLCASPGPVCASAVKGIAFWIRSDTVLPAGALKIRVHYNNVMADHSDGYFEAFSPAMPTANTWYDQMVLVDPALFDFVNGDFFSVEVYANTTLPQNTAVFVDDFNACRLTV